MSWLFGSTKDWLSYIERQRSAPQWQWQSEPRLHRRNAAMCLDCEALFRADLNACPGCASRTFVALTQLLDRKPPKKETP